MSSSSLYGNVGNVTVSSKNLTTLYNATTGNTVVANVPDRNFTTLYAAAGQTNIMPTRPYGNSNVEAFLNAGTDGANTVYNINMSGQLTVGGQSFLGDVDNVHIDGGSSGFVLTTNGVGNLIWAEPQGGGGEGTEYIHFDVTTNGNNQTFTDSLLINYANANVMNLFKNGVNIEPEFYEKTADDTVQVNIPLATGDTIDVLASSGGGGGGLPAGIPESVQFNTGYAFGGDSYFLYNTTTHVLSVPTVSGNLEGLADEASVAYSVDVGNVVGIGNIATVNLDGSSSTVLYGNGVFGAASSAAGGANTSIQFNGDGVLTGDDYFTYAFEPPSGVSTVNLGYTGLFSGGSSLSLNGRNGNTKFTQTGINGGMTIDVNGSNSVLTINAATTNLGANSNVKITGGSSGQFLSTDGAGNLAWATSSSGTPSGSNTSIQFNGDGSFAGDDYFTYVYDGGTSLSTLNIGYTGILSSGSVLSLNGRSGNTQFTQTGVNGGLTIDVNGSNSVLTLNAATANLISNVSIQGMTTIQEAKEKFTPNASGATGTVNFDVLTSAIILQTANASANFTLNVRGNGTTTFDSITSNNQSMSVTYVNKSGATGYYANVIQIDGSNVTPVWLNGSVPASGTPSGYDVYNFNILKTGTATYVVFGAVGSYV